MFGIFLFSGVFFEAVFSVYFPVPLFQHFGPIWSPKVPHGEAVQKSMFYVCESLILRVREGPGTVKVRGAFLVALGDAFRDVCDFWVPPGVHNGTLFGNTCSFVGLRHDAI